MMPVISVIMVVKDEINYIKDAIQSILNQNLKAFELIIIDGGSADGTKEIIASFDDPRVIKLYTEASFVDSKNIGIERARGEYITFMDGDDISHPDRLYEQYKFLKAHPEVDLFGTHCYVDKGERMGESCPPAEHEDIVKLLYKDSPFIHSTVMVKKKVLQEAGLYRTKYYCEDYDLFVRIAQKYRTANIPLKLVTRNHHQDSLGNKIKRSRAYINRLKVQLQAVRLLGFRPICIVYITKTLVSIAVAFIRETVYEIN